jgi:transposase
VIEYGGKRVDSIKKSFHRAAVKAGMPEVTPHVLRHSVATWMAMAGRSFAEIAAFLGNSIKMVEKVYAKYTPGYLKDAVDSSGGKTFSLTPEKNAIGTAEIPRRGRLVQVNQIGGSKQRTAQKKETTRLEEIVKSQQFGHRAHS